MTVLSIVAILSAVAIPQMIAQRRLTRSNALAREIAVQMRYARQLAMSQRQAFTFSYDNTNKQVIIIDNNASGTAVMLDGAYPNTAGSSILRTIPLTQGGLAASEITYGTPAALPVGAQGALADGVSRTALANSRINITFQPDGSVIDGAGNPANSGLFIYNSSVPTATAAAISVLGSSGRVKIWRYTSGVNLYAE